MPSTQAPTHAEVPASWTRFWNRRDVLKAGAVSLAAGVAPDLPAAAASPQPRAQSVVLLWMAGGMTHHDSFDPKPEAPAEVRGTLQAIATAIPGVRFCEVMPHLARQANQFAVVRSYAHDSNDHFISQAHALSGRRVTAAQITSEPNVGAIVSKLLGPRAGLPGYIAVPGTTRPGPPPTNLFGGGWLGQEFAPFSTGGRARNEDFTARVLEARESEFNQQGLRLLPDLDGTRLSGRQNLRQKLDAALAHIEGRGLDRVLERQLASAFNMLQSPSVRRAFDIELEPARVQERYGQTKIGQRCLLARRLVEAGARFVMVDYGYDPEYGNLWDNHNAPTQNHPPICEIVKKPWHLAGVDRACAALLEDLACRGLLARTLVVLLTEFGRTPKINPQGGRDHWGAAGSLLFAGAGIRGGQVIGATDRQGAFPTTVSHSPGDVAATIYEALGIAPETLLYDRQHRPIPVLPEGRAIAGLF